MDTGEKKDRILKKGRRIDLLILAVVLCVIVFFTARQFVKFGTYEETIFGLLPPAIAIILALVTKEVYSSLIIGIATGALLYNRYNPGAALITFFNDGVVSVLSDSYNMGILVFLVILGILVALMNKAGGSAAFGRWAAKNIKTRVGAQIATIFLGICIFIDDYFNCLTVGSVMRPVTDNAKISRAKLAYLIDATAAPICIIAPVSSWAAAVSGYAGDGGFSLFIKAIPFNFYAILTIVMMFALAFMKFDYGTMKNFEKNAIENGDIFSGLQAKAAALEEASDNEKGRTLDLVLPVVILIISCVVGMIYSGEYFNAESEAYRNFVVAFSKSDASVGLMLGSAVTLLVTVIYYLCRKVLSFENIMGSFPEGFKSMVPAILILTFAWSLKSMTDLLGATVYVEQIVKSGASSFQAFLPAIIFLIACVISFATGTSWGTFGILIPITLAIFPVTMPIGVVCVSACMAGAVCGDHCSPISDTTIMASAGAQCDHVTHVSTQLPYAVTVAIVSFATYIFAGFVPKWYVALPVGIALMIGTLFAIKVMQGKKNQAA